MHTLDSNYIEQRMGWYRALFAATIQFNSLVFRVVVGVVGGVFPEAIAVAMILEFWLTAIFEVPGGYLADRFGRMPVASVGFCLVSAAIVCNFFAVFFAGTGTSVFFICFSAVLLGFGSPLISGSVIGFYQEALANSYETHAKKGSSPEIIKLRLQKSMNLTQKSGKHAPLLGVGLALVLLFFLNRYQLTHICFLIGASMHLYLTSFILRDYQRLKIKDKNKKYLGIKHTILNTFKSSRSRGGIFHMAIFFVGVSSVAGYLAVSLGREYYDTNKWVIIGTFMLSYGSIGWYLRGLVLPYLVEKLSKTMFLITAYTMILISGLVLLAIPTSLIFLCAAVAVSSSLYALGSGAIINYSKNEIIADLHHSEYATALSIGSIPGYLVIVGISSVVAYCGGNFPVSMIALTVVASGIIGCTASILFQQQKKAE